MVIFLYNLYIFVLRQHGCFANKIFTLDPNNSVLKRLRHVSIGNIVLFSMTIVFSFEVFEIKIPVQINFRYNDNISSQRCCH